MNVYAISAYGSYGGGMAVVAAKDEEQAKKIAHSSIQDVWQTRYYLPTRIITLPVEYTGPAAVLEHFETGE